MAMAKGAIRATVAMLPGPIVVKTNTIRKIMSGMRAAFPLARRTALMVSLSSVPFSWAMPNRNVTPKSVINSEVGQNPKTLLPLKFPQIVPTKRAKKIPKRPGFHSSLKQLMTMTIARATKESNAAVENIRYPSRFERVIYRDIYAFYLSYYLRNVKMESALILWYVFGTQTSERESKIGLKTAAVLLGAVGAFAWYFSELVGRNYGMGITGGWSNIWSVWLSGKPFSWDGLSVFGIVVGAAISAVMAKEFKLRMPRNPITYVQVMGGGIIMGFGATIGGG